MSLPIRLDTIIPIVIAPFCISLCIHVIMRLKNIPQKNEGYIFSILCIATACWAMGPLLNIYYKNYGWYSALFVSNAAILYTLYITNFKLLKIFLPLTILSSGSILFLLISGQSSLPGFQIKFSYLLFPLLLFMNGVIYFYYFKFRTKFHLSIAFMTTAMILGGFYDTFKIINNWPLIPAATLSTLGFIIVIGYHIINRGYLQIQGWKDYAIELKQKETLLNEQFTILKKANMDSVVVLSQTIEAKDHYTRGHCLRVRDFALTIGKALKLDNERLSFLELGAILHDIGKIGIPGIILNKNDKLTEIEFSEIKKHPDMGADILKTIKFFNPIIPMIRHHHEFFNGNGYPNGLSYDKIPLEARILAVGDAFDAMTSDRPYRKAFSIGKALMILKKVAGTQLDPEIVKIFINKKVYQTPHNVSDKLNIHF